MPQHLTISEAFSQWLIDVRPAVLKQYGAHDVPALSESWNDYTDMLCKDGQLNQLQYHHCPAYDEEIPDSDDEPAWILERMGVTMSVTTITERKDDLNDWQKGSRHFSIYFRREGWAVHTEYSMGPALTHDPEPAEVMKCLLDDAAGTDGTEFEDWAEEYGYSPDSRRAERIFNQCKEVARMLGEMFQGSELDDLREIFADV